MSGPIAFAYPGNRCRVVAKAAACGQHRISVLPSSPAGRRHTPGARVLVSARMRRSTRSSGCSSVTPSLMGYRAVARISEGAGFAAGPPRAATSRAGTRSGAKACTAPSPRRSGASSTCSESSSFPKRGRQPGTHERSDLRWREHHGVGAPAVQRVDLGAPRERLCPAGRSRLAARRPLRCAPAPRLPERSGGSSRTTRSRYSQPIRSTASRPRHPITLNGRRQTSHHADSSSVSRGS